MLIREVINIPKHLESEALRREARTRTRREEEEAKGKWEKMASHGSARSEWVLAGESNLLVVWRAGGEDGRILLLFAVVRTVVGVARRSDAARSSEVWA